MSVPPDRRPVAVLVSGGGSNLQAIIDAAAEPGYGACVSVVISDRSGVAALDKAAAAHIPTEVVEWGSFPDREAFTRAVCDTAVAHGAEALVLAGFMRILHEHAVRRFPNRILNIHPALLPAFPGAHAVEDALAHGVKVTGVTVHFVDEEVDHGPIVLQEPLAILPADDAATLHARIQEIEHRVYPSVIHAFAVGRLEVCGRTVHWKDPS